ncbi:fibronectin type III domain-containing protein [Peterkaempfera sp. SMS 1(5)a]|uniref:fibronectin type III domain-containing protein n=1 Tax=Peterkaempfera podocarpi TaxID=3232308 RepID=UPI00366C1AF5
MTPAPSRPSAHPGLRRCLTTALALGTALAAAPAVPAAAASPQPPAALRTASAASPSAPGHLRVPALAYDEDSISLVWDQPDDRAGITGYRVYRDGSYIGTAGQDSASAAQPYIDRFYADPANSRQVRVLAHHFTAEGLRPHTRYRFTVRAVDSAGQESADSTSVVQSTTAVPKVFDVRDYGAAGDGSTLDTAAVQAAIDAATPGSKVLLSGGVFRTGALWLKSDLTFEVATGATLLGSADADDYPYGYQMYAYSTDPRFHSLLNAQTWDYGSLHDIRITGGGTIDGNGWKQDGTDADGFPVSAESSPATLEANGILAKAQVAKATALGSTGAYSTRSNLITLRGVRNAYLGDITAVNPSYHTLVSLHSDDVTVADTRLTTYDINNGDGIDFGHGSGLTVFGTVFDTGDDAMNFAAGLGAQAEQDVPTGGAWIFDNYFHRGHGAVVAGSHTGAWIQDITAEDNVIEGTDIGLRMKTAPQNGGGARRVLFRDNALKDIGTQAFVFTSAYADPNAAITFEPAPDKAHFTDVTVQHVTVDGTGQESIKVLGVPDSYHQRLRFSDVRFLAAKPASLRYLRDSSFDGVVFDTTADPWQIQDSTGLSFGPGTTETAVSEDAARAPVWPQHATVTALPSDTAVTLDWSTASDTSAVTGYRILVDGRFAAAFAGGTHSGQVTGLAPDTVHTVQVQAVDATGATTDGPRARVRTTGTADRTPPVPPAGGSAFSVVPGSTGSTWAALTWTAATDDHGIGRYELYRTGHRIATADGAALALTATGLTPATAYSFRLRVVDTSGNSAWYPVVAQTVTAPPVALNPIP